METTPQKSKRGFASMDPAKQKEIASRGGKAAHAKGTAHEFTSEEARGAGRKGGLVVSRDRAHMVAIGREGGHMRAKKAKLRLLQSQQTSSAASSSSSIEAAKSNEKSQEASGQNPDWHPLSA
jgi:general stress protein YciG